jgi:hypothetical protein
MAAMKKAIRSYIISIGLLSAGVGVFLMLALEDFQKQDWSNWPLFLTVPLFLVVIVRISDKILKASS